MTTVAEPLVYCDVRCPNARCRRFIVRLPLGTVIEKLYCRGCRELFANLVAH